MSDANNYDACPACQVVRTRHAEALGVEEAGRADTTRFLELFNSNVPPSEPDATILRAVADESQCLLKDLDAHIQHTEAIVSRLRELRAVALGRLSRARTVLHPLRTLPREILAEIFLSCAPDPADLQNVFVGSSCPDSSIDSLNPHNHPWNLTHVCRQWRDVALALPRLWSTIYLNLPFYEVLSFRQCVFKGRMLFDRAGTQPIDIYLYSDDVIEDPNPGREHGYMANSVCQPAAAILSDRTDGRPIGLPSVRRNPCLIRWHR